MLNSIGSAVWNSKYAAYEGETFKDGCKRVVSITDGYFNRSEQSLLFDMLYNLKFSPGGRIWFSAGKEKPQYANCALFSVDDTKESWGSTLSDIAVSLMSGNGIGIEVSNIRGKGERINGSGGTASGTLSYVSMINEVARHIMQGNIHRSACHSAVHWKHKDVYHWLTSKQWDENYTRLKSISYDYPAPFDTFNLSIRYDTDFIEAYHNPENALHTYAVDLWNAHTRVMFEFSDPSIQFDTDDNILRNACCEIISDTNGDSCHLASINLANIKGYPELKQVVSMMTKFMMVVKNVDTYALPFMRDIGLSNGRLGLGVMGLHNWLLQRELPYQWCDDLYGLFDTYTYTAREQAYETAIDYGFSEPVALFAQAPTGSIARLHNGISGGIEPVYSAAYKWRYQSKGKRIEETVIDPYVYRLIKEGKINPYEPFKDALSLANPEGIQDRVYMQSMIQYFTDNAISSTINLPQWGTEGNNESTLPYYRNVLIEYLPKLRGITVYADGAREGQPMTSIPIIDALNETGLIEDTQYSNCNSGLCAT